MVFLDTKSLEILEFPKVRELLAGFTAFTASKELALNFVPSSDAETVTRWLGESAEARRLLSQEAGLSLGGASDVREAAEMAQKGKMLEPQTLHAVRETLAIARRVRDGLQKRADGFPLLWDLAKDIVPLAYIEEHIASAIAPGGEVLDSASPELGRLRRELRVKRERLRARLDAIVKSGRSQRFLQEAVITERDGRYVVPVKAEMKKEFRGIVHDVSNTGVTVFIEPLVTVELGNELRELEVAEKREVERILLVLSTEVGANVNEIAVHVARMAAVDLALAKARFAARFKAEEAAITAEKVLKLVNARHPLLGDKAVPLSVEIGRDFSGLVITGPNTGGKTVALKTIGLTALMTLAGMPIPASSGSLIPVFDGVFADIGDEQSIESTLSTFSWHMGNIVRIIKNSTAKSLVLLDELGSSTDPEEGAALARALLLYFLERGSLVVATSHFNELKVFAHRTPGLQNASLDFDPVTLAPTYRLVLGIPGGSNALATAVRLGLPEQIAALAKGLLGKASQDLAELLNDLNQEKQRLEVQRHDLGNASAKAQALGLEMETARQNLKEREAAVLSEARDRVVAEAAELQRLIRQAAADLKKTKTEEGLAQAREALASVHGRLRKTAPPTVQTGTPAEVKTGDRVLLGDIGLEATILSVDKTKRQVEVQAGATRARVSLDSVTKVGGAPAGKPSARLRSQIPAKTVPMELDLRGRRADEVALAVGAYLDDATLANLDGVRIIHGFGTGVVRQIVRETLAGHPLVKSFRSGGRGEGGDGATVVSLKES
ncbi:MAG: endonuclease MutS2 [Dehalococcoidia bacterium]|nr:MAG: endonuclease MutS2 [Dehalococcoidia bacterium]